MKIRKEFIPLILSGEKKYEFRNSKGKEGIYKINGIWLQLVKYQEYNKNHRFYLDKKDWFNEVDFYFCSCKITELEYLWIQKNKSYFENGQVYIFEWKILGENALKELEGV